MRTWPGTTAALAAIILLTMATHFSWFPSNDFYYNLATEIRVPVPAWKLDPTSILAKAGLRIGDVVRSIDGVPVDDRTEFSLHVIASYGKDVEIVVDRPEGR